MSTNVYEGDEWKHKAKPEPISTKSRTRAAEQEFVNTEFCNGRITLDEWRRRTDELSEPTKWSASGRVRK